MSDCNEPELEVIIILFLWPQKRSDDHPTTEIDSLWRSIHEEAQKLLRYDVKTTPID